MKHGGQIPWCVTAICETFKTSCLTEKPSERRFGESFTGPVIPFGSMVEYHPISAEDLSRIHQFGKKVLRGIFLGYALYAGESGKETFWLQILWSWNTLARQKSMPEDSMRKK